MALDYFFTIYGALIPLTSKAIDDPIHGQKLSFISFIVIFFVRITVQVSAKKHRVHCVEVMTKQSAPIKPRSSLRLNQIRDQQVIIALLAGITLFGNKIPKIDLEGRTNL